MLKIPGLHLQYHKRDKNRASKMAQQVKARAKSDNLSSIPGIYMVGNRILKAIF